MDRWGRVVAFLCGGGIGRLGVLATLPRAVSDAEAEAIAEDLLGSGGGATDVEIGSAILAVTDRPPAPAEIVRIRRKVTARERGQGGTRLRDC